MQLVTTGEAGLADGKRPDSLFVPHPTPRRACCDLWIVDLDGEPMGQVPGPLSAAELERASQFRAPPDAKRYAASRLAIRRLLSFYAGVSPGDIVFTADEGGKPRAKGVDLGFSWSRSGGFLLFGIAESEIGVDLEAGEPFPEMAGVSAGFTHSEEKSILGFQGAEATDNFYRIWTLKEAFVKATGEGLRRSFGSFEFMEADSPHRFKVLAQGKIGDGWTGAHHRLGGGLHASVVASDNLDAIHWSRLPATIAGGSPCV